MSQTGPWSVKGIDQRAREAAREAAGAEGMTLGEYLNKILLTPDDTQPNEVIAPLSPKAAPASAAVATSALDNITRRIEATEARSTLAITGMDQTVLGLVARLENAEQGSASIAGHVEGLIDELKSTHETLQDKVTNLEADDSTEKNLEALKSVENALGKLASHVYEENEMAQNETQAIKGRVEAGFSDVTERVETMETRVEQTLSSAAARVERAVEQAELRAEGTARHLSDRITSIETNVAERLQGVGDSNARLDSVEADVSGALDSMEGTLLRIQERLNRAETTTDTALKSLESTFEHLDEKVEAVANAADPELAERLRAEFEARFEDLSTSVRDTVANARTELADEITKAAETSADSEVVLGLQDEMDALKARLEAAEQSQNDGDPQIVSEIKLELADVQTRLEQSETQQTVAIDAINDQVEQISSGLMADVQTRLEESESKQTAAIEAVGDQVEQISNSFEDRFMEIAARDDSAATEAIRSEIDRLSENVGEKIEGLADQVDARINDSEQRSADAIVQIGDQVAAVSTRMQTRQEEGLRLLHKELDETRKRSDARLSDALSNVSERLELIQTQSSASLSPVQKAIASLATRLESVEEFNAPPFADDTVNAALPDFPEHPDTPPLFDPATLANLAGEDDFSSDAVSFEPTFDEIDDAVDDAVSGEGSAQFSEAMLAGIMDEPNSAPKFEPTTNAQADEAEFEAGIDGWEVGEKSENPYADDFEAIAAAAATINLEASEDTHEYVAEVPGDIVGEDMMDSLSELEAIDHGASETRESDIFDEEPAEHLAAPLEDTFDDIDGSVSDTPEEMDAETSDYIARARRAAIAAASTGSGSSKSTKPSKKKRKGGGNGGGKSTSGGSKKVPLLAAASVIAIGGAAVGLHVLRGKQAAPVQSVAIDTYQDPGTATTPAAGAGIETASTAALADTDPASDTTPAIDAAPEDLFDSGTTDTATATTKTEAPQTAAVSFPAIPAPVSVESAANSGNRIAQYQLGQANIEAGGLQEGANLIRKSANKDLPIAQYRLAKLHEKGIGVAKDLKLARKWTEKSARGGNIKAMHDLAVFMAEGEGGEQTYAGAVEWFRKAAEFDIVDSQYNLGVLYEQGLGISPNPQEALFWFQIAAKNGDTGAPAKIRELKARVSSADASKILTRSSAWQPGRTNPIANGRFGAQSWNTGNPLQAKAVQTALNAIGYSVGEPDGVIGVESANAIRNYQTKNGLNVTGKVDAALIESLNAKANGGAQG